MPFRLDCRHISDVGRIGKDAAAHVPDLAAGPPVYDPARAIPVCSEKRFSGDSWRQCNLMVSGRLIIQHGISGEIMTQELALADRLRPMVGKVIIWRAEAQRVRLAAMEASERNTADPTVLEGIEATAGALYKEIEQFRLLLEETVQASPKAAGQLAEIDDALHLMLMEITELGTQMYSIHSRVA
jgi:hypothetical protein